MQYLFLPFNGRSSIFKMWEGNQKCRKKLLKRERKKKAPSAFGKRTGLLLLCVQLAPAVATEPGLLMWVVWVMCDSLVWGLILPFSLTKELPVLLSACLAVHMIRYLTLPQLIPKVLSTPNHSISLWFYTYPYNSLDENIYGCFDIFMLVTITTNAF